MLEVTNEEIVRKIKEKQIVAPEFIKKNQGVLLKALWILKVCKDNGISTSLSPSGISYIAHHILDEYLSENSISKAFSRAGKKIRNMGNGYYEIMGLGRKDLEEPDFGEKIYFLSGKDNWSDKNKKWAEIISLLKGDIKIVDKFYNSQTLHRLFEFGRSKNIKFMTSKEEGNIDLTKLRTDIVDFKKEFPNISLKKYPKEYELHDRYLICDNFLVLIGRGLSGLGDKESFLVVIPKNECKEVADDLEQIFNERWEKCQNI